MISYAALPFYLGGTSILIVVSVTMDTVSQVQGYRWRINTKDLSRCPSCAEQTLMRLILLGPPGPGRGRRRSG